jgi:hypothetical protein
MMAAVRGGLMAAALAGLVLAPSGCSYLFSQPPPPRPLRWDGECSTSRLPVAGDVYLAVNSGAIALVGFVGAGIVASNRSNTTAPSWDTESDSTATTTLLIVGALGAAATFGLIKSANHGLDSARACDAAQLALLQQQAGWGAPPPWPAPAYPPPPAGPPQTAPAYPPPALPVPAPAPLPVPAPAQ